MATKELKGVEIFAEGTWNGLTFDDAALDAMATSFDALGLSGRVPLKLGHEGEDARDDPETQFALGWVTKVYRQGKMLLSDWEVPAKVAQWIDDGLLRHVSVELLKDVQAGTRVLPWVLDAVALLGSDQPAVGILKDLKESMARRATHSSHGGLVSFSRDGAIKFKSTGVSSGMSEANAIATLTARLEELSIQVQKFQGDNEALKKENNELKGIKTSFSALEEQVQKDKVAAQRAMIDAKLEAAVKSEDCQPSVREKFQRAYNTLNDEAVMRVKPEDVEAFVKAHPNPYKTKVAKSEIVSLAKSTDELPEDMPADEAMALRVDAFCREAYGADKTPTGDQMLMATKAVMKRFPSLAQAYKGSVLVKTGRPN